ncbi:MAG: nickel insertion protein [Promethearchaeota archaeon]
MSSSKILVIDPQLAGIAGDMFVAALLDLGADRDTVVSAMEASVNYVPNCHNVSVRPQSITRSHISGLFLKIRIEESFTTRPGRVLLESVETMARDLKLSTPASAFAHRAIHILVEAEARVHKHPPEDVHLHAAGSVDTVLDIIGAATALDNLGIANPTTTSYFTLPIAVGGGTFPSGHGILAAPGPAVMNILTTSKLAFRGGPQIYEMATPTGVSLLAALNPVSTPVFPELYPLAVGYGAGTGELPEIPNLLRFVLGVPKITTGNKEA